jgi:hypothetical protein
MRRPADRLPLSPLGAAAVFLALALALALAWEATGRQVTDVALYRAYGEQMASGSVPYRDFAFEYPPLALPGFLLPALVTSGLTPYSIVFALLMALLGSAGVLVTDRSLVALGRGPSARAAVLWLLALSPLVLGPVLLARYDLLPVLAVAAATLALLRGHDRRASLLLGLGIAAKLYPALLLPIWLTVAWRRRGRREAAVGLCLAACVTLAAYLPFLLVAPAGVAESVGRQLGRPLQIESLGAGILLVLHNVAGMPLDWESAHGSQNLTGAASAVLGVVLGIAQLAAAVFVSVRFARGRAEPERVARYVAAGVVGFVAFGRVLSPQFMVWPLLAVPLVAGARGRAAGALYAVACALTLGWFPAWYWALVKEFDPVGSFFVLARDATLVALFVVLALPLRASRREPARSRSPGR